MLVAASDSDLSKRSDVGVRWGGGGGGWGWGWVDLSRLIALSNHPSRHLKTPRRFQLAPNPPSYNKGGLFAKRAAS